MSNTSTESSIVPVLVDQFNGIIHWRAKTLQEQVHSFEQQKHATPKALPFITLKSVPTSTSSADDHQLHHNVYSHPLSSHNVIPCDLSTRVPIPLGKSSSFGGLTHQDLPLCPRQSKSQKQFSRKLNRVRARAESNTINETMEYEMDGSDPLQDTENFLMAIRKRLTKCRTDLAQAKNDRLVANHVGLLEDCDNPIYQPSFQSSPLSLPEETLPPPVCESQPIREEFEPEFKPEKREPLYFIEQKILPKSNILLDKLQNIYQHSFVVKTIVVEKMSLLGSRTGFLDKDEQSGICCACGESYMFSDKHLQCINCLTRCHTTCGSEIATPCVKFVDPYLKPSSCITAYVFPRARPSIPSLVIHCVREIEHRLQQKKPTITAPPKLYYVDVQKMKPIKDECKKLIMKGRFGVPPMGSYTFDYLSAMVKLFLGDIVEPVFGKEQWKEYSQSIHRKTDGELKDMLIDTIDTMPQTAQHTLCFMLLHLKHLIKHEFQDIDIIVSVFCPILMGDIDVRRKIRLCRLMLTQMEDNVLLSFVEH